MTDRESWCTIVVPTYNGERLVGDLIRSLLVQDLGSYKLLFIDDGSTDRTIETIEAYVRGRARIVRHSKNIGLYATLNAAIDEVCTPYVCLLFQDDWVAADYLPEMRAVVEKYPEASFVWSAINTVDSSGERVTFKGIDTRRVELITPGPAPWRSAMQRGTFWTISGSVTKTDRIRSLRFDESLPHCADFELLLRGLRSDTFLYFERPLVNIREHAGQASTRNLAESKDIIEALEVRREQLRLWRPDVNFALRLHLFLHWIDLIFRRAVGQVRRGHHDQAFRTCGLVLLAAKALFGLSTSVNDAVVPTGPAVPRAPSSDTTPMRETAPHQQEPLGRHE